MSDALDELISAVEAGTLDTEDEWRPMCDMFPMSQAEVVAGDYESNEVANIRHAFHGSLDAALALHAALLPGWGWDLSDGSTATVADMRNKNSRRWLLRRGDAPTPARAMLLATLKGYRSIKEESE